MGDRASGLVLPLSIVVSVAVGAVIGGLFARGAATPTAPASLPMGEAKELTDAIHALRLEMEHAREPRAELTAPIPTAVPSRVDASRDVSLDANVSSSDVAKELSEATAELVRAVGELRASVQSFGPEPAPPVFPNVQPAPAMADAVEALPAETRNRTFLFWTYQQVATRFGAPTSTGRTKSGETWWYFGGTPDGSGVKFFFANGSVYAIE